MKEITGEEYYTALKKADSKVIELINSNQLYDCISAVLRQNSEPINPSDALIPTAYFLIGAYTLDDAAQSFLEIGAKNSLRFLADLQEQVNQIVSVKTETQTEKKELASEIIETEKELASIQTVRTMPHDMAAIKPGSDVVYQSSQADILSKGEGGVPSVASAAPQATRWDTDTRPQ